MTIAIRESLEQDNIAARQFLTFLIQPNPNTRGLMTNAPTPRPGSFQYALAALAVGESISKVRKLDHSNIVISDYQAEMTSLKRTMSNALRNAVVRASETTGGTYQTTVSETLTSAGEFWCVAIITRTI